MTAVSNTIRKRVKERIQSDVDTLNAHYGKNYAAPSVAYDVRGSNAGYVSGKDGHRIIHLNPILLNENTDAMIARTVPHELAHWAENKIHGGWQRSRSGKRSVHGRRWKNIMAVLGADASRCHTMNVANASVRTKNKFEYECECGKRASVGPVVHRKLQNGSSHSHCRGKTLTFIKALGQVTYTEAREARAAEAQATPASPKRPKAASASGSKKQQAQAIFAEYKSQDRATIIQLFIDNLNMTKAGATTYYYNCSKAA